MIWEPFILALVLGIIVSAGLYFAYLWPSVEPEDPSDEPAVAIVEPASASSTAPVEPATTAAAEPASAAP